MESLPYRFDGPSCMISYAGNCARLRWGNGSEFVKEPQENERIKVFRGVILGRSSRPISFEEAVAEPCGVLRSAQLQVYRCEVVDVVTPAGVREAQRACSVVGEENVFRFQIRVNESRNVSRCSEEPHRLTYPIEGVLEESLFLRRVGPGQACRVQGRLQRIRSSADW